MEKLSLLFKIISERPSQKTTDIRLSFAVAFVSLVTPKFK